MPISLRKESDYKEGALGLVNVLREGVLQQKTQVFAANVFEKVQSNSALMQEVMVYLL